MSESSPTATATTPVDPLADRNYRVRRLKIILDVDFYDDNGLLINRGDSDPVIVSEATFPRPLIEAIATATGMRKGFALLAPPESPATAPAPVE